MDICIDNLKVERGCKKYGKLSINDNAGNETEIPFFIINGTKEGPRICITAGVHGTEYPGIEALFRLFKNINPENLSGVIVGSPMCNFAAFQRRSMFVNPIDGKNLNEIFPGNPEGTITEIIADTLLNTLVKGSDYHIDLHSGDSIEDLYPYAFYHLSGNVEIDNKSRWMAELYGLDYIAVTQLDGIGASDKGNFYSSVSEMGIPSIQPEVGGLGLLKEEMVKIHYNGVRNILINLDMIQGEAIKNHKQDKLERFIRIRSQINGIFYPNVVPGQKIKKGDNLGTITDYKKETEMVSFVAEENGVVLWIIASPAVKQGDALMAIGIG